MVDDVLLNKASTIERCVARAREEYLRDPATFASDHSRQSAGGLHHAHDIADKLRRDPAWFDHRKPDVERRMHIDSLGFGIALDSELGRAIELFERLTGLPSN